MASEVLWLSHETCRVTTRCHLRRKYDLSFEVRLPVSEGSQCSLSSSPHQSLGQDCCREVDWSLPKDGARSNCWMVRVCSCIDACTLACFLTPAVQYIICGSWGPCYHVDKECNFCAPLLYIGRSPFSVVGSDARNVPA